MTPMKNLFPRNLSPAAAIGLILGVLVVYGLILFFWAWVLNVILQWFNIDLPLWKDLLIIIFLQAATATTSASTSKRSKR